MSIVLSVEENPAKDDLETFWNILREFNRSQVGDPMYRQLCILIRDELKQVLGGLNGQTGGSWLYIANLAVSEQLRGQGLGSMLLTAAEDEAVRRGCKYAHLDTYSFQALPFYQRHNYEIFGILEDCPPGHKRFFLKKNLG